jgi:hypothetical protein
MNYTTELQIGDSVEYIEPANGFHHTGTVLAVDFGNGWYEIRIRVQWEDMQPTWVRASTLVKLP